MRLYSRRQKTHHGTCPSPRGRACNDQTERFKAFEVFKAKNARLLELIEGRLLKAPGATEYRDFCQKAGER